MLCVEKTIKSLNKKEIILRLEDFKESYYVQIEKIVKCKLFKFKDDLSVNKKIEFLSSKLKIGKISAYLIMKGFNFQTNKEPFIRISILKELCKISNISLKEIEKSIIAIKLGKGSRPQKLNLPIYCSLKSKNPLKRRLAEDYYENKIKMKFDNFLKLQLPIGFVRENNYLILRPDEILKSQNYVNTIKRRKGTINYGNNRIILRYLNTNTSSFVKKIIPKEIVINEKFTKEFGKWMGDRCGGLRTIGLSSKDLAFIEEFLDFLVNDLKQPKKQIAIYIQYLNYINQESLQKLLEDKLNIKVKLEKNINMKKQTDIFNLRLFNAPLKYFVFDYLEEWWDIILLSSTQNVREAYYAGLFEADGSYNEKRGFSVSFASHINKTNNLII